jgi:ABC-type maltose transport system permease subunit
MKFYSHWPGFESATEWLSPIIHDTATFILALALAYLAYGVVHQLMYAVARMHWAGRHVVLEVCRRVLIMLIYVIAALYALEYWSMILPDVA